ncbi:hypothetical protein MACK_002383 [Theileria orientalis]|uniref:Uncharacterized protein n=1 Tax=Theileria orientalis TaxID=68886 RepID=A0A976MBK1_THEOR|nr:hypothetical protein MACK_002383 [Theileria orientalis]
MGNSSNSIDLFEKNGTGISNHCEFKIKRTMYKDSSDFEIITYIIRYNNTYHFRDKSYFSVSVDDFNDVTVFGFYDPSTKRDVVDKVEVYYSIFKRRNPLIIVFTTRDGKKRYYYYKRLCNNQYVYHSLPNEHFKEVDLKDELVKENNRVNKTLIFKLEMGNNINIKQIPESVEDQLTIGRGDKFKKVMYVPNSDTSEGGSPGGPFVFHNYNLFTLKPKGYGIRNEINASHLVEMDNREINAIRIYYSKSGNVALLVEFIEMGFRHQYIRKDKDGYYWEKVTINYNNECDLENKLKQVKSYSDSNDIITYILYKSSSHNGSSFEQQLDSYSDLSEYTHTSSETS